MVVLGNRGTCAQSCRLPYKLLENDNEIDKGYLLSPRDLCSIDEIKELIDAGVTSFKIEGRMKKPEYVATVTSIYRKYIDEIMNTNKNVTLSPSDLTDLMQVFNRGSFSHGHLDYLPNKDLIFKEKPNNMGIYLGKILNYNNSKGYIKIKLENPLSIGDSISINDSIYHVSELMKNNNNIKLANISDTVTIGRMKGNNIKLNSKIYKIQSKELSDKALKSYSNIENIKIPLKATIIVHKNKPITLNVETLEKESSFFNNINITLSSDITPQEATNAPITKDRIITQLSKTGNTEFEFKKINIDLEDNLFVPNISLNELRRQALSKIEDAVLNKLSRDYNKEFKNKFEDTDNTLISTNTTNIKMTNKKINILLNLLHTEYDYTLINGVDNVYIPFKYFIDKKYKETILKITNKFNTHIYLPTISKDYYLNLIKNNLLEITKTYKISGIVVSNLGEFGILKNIFKNKDIDITANYTFNVFNNYSEEELSSLGFDTFTISPELDRFSITSILKNKKTSSELIIYGKTPVMNSNYCLLGNSNKCYKECLRKCENSNKYYLKDRMGFKFRIIPDNSQTITTIYNSKILSISPLDFDSDNYRIDLLDESIFEINNIISTIRSGNRLEGENYTNGNLNRNI